MKRWCRRERRRIFVPPRRSIVSFCRVSRVEFLLELMKRARVDCVVRKLGCFRSSEGFSQAISLEERPRLILLLFGGIPNSP